MKWEMITGELLLSLAGYFSGVVITVNTNYNICNTYSRLI